MYRAFKIMNKTIKTMNESLELWTKLYLRVEQHKHTLWEMKNEKEIQWVHFIKKKKKKKITWIYIYI